MPTTTDYYSKTIDFDKVRIEADVFQDCAKNMGWREKDETEDIAPYIERMKRMSPIDIFKRSCDWNGLVNWGSSLWGTVSFLQENSK